MPDLAQLIHTGAANPWLYLPLAVVLGALHALEPGHSKSMMAAFVVATRGTPAQAALLGGSAAIGHTLVVWALAALGLYLGNSLILEAAEPWLIFISGLLILGLALRMFMMIRSDHAHRHEHAHAHAHAHHHEHDDHHHHEEDLSHEEEHAREVQEKFAGRSVTNFDIAWFGLTGGLLPCPSAIAVLLVCLQLKAFTLGLTMVAGFSIGLAITLISVGVLAAWGSRHARQHWSGFDQWSEYLPLISTVLVAIIGLLISMRGLMALGFV